jgi:hypothetical protein
MSSTVVVKKNKLMVFHTGTPKLHTKSNASHATVRIGDHTVSIEHGVTYDLEQSDTGAVKLIVLLNNQTQYAMRQCEVNCFVEVTRKQAYYPPTEPLETYYPSKPYQVPILPTETVAFCPVMEEGSDTMPFPTDCIDLS